ncbi:MAG: DsbA family protein [Saccharospirillaceae bacterium]|nr:DsbA family protein [Saccharospirillaceae bacterium]MCD8533173.1 DsbA family protein [Saccharospirillaceae bacterium]
MSQVSKQKGASNSNPSSLRRWFISFLLRRASDEVRLQKLRGTRESKRKAEGRSHVVEYFHQVDDAYSHLTLQIIKKLKEKYSVNIIVNLVPGLRDDNFPEPDLWSEVSRKDAADIAPYFALSFPECPIKPDEDMVLLATKVLCALSSDQFFDIGFTVSDHLWKGDYDGIRNIADQYGVSSDSEIASALERGQKRRAELGHYGSANLWYEGEWYWKPDRIYHLEERLLSLGVSKGSDQTLIAPRAVIPSQFSESAKNLTLEYYVSLRSPYTAVSWHPTLKLAKDSGIHLSVRPVLPMVMRGVPATFQKGMYIWFDAAREARAMGLDYGNFYDPIGRPVMRGYSLYMWAMSQNKGESVIEAFLKAAFSQGINTNTQSGIRKVVEDAGLDWHEAKQHLDDDTCLSLLEDNRKSMYGFGNWGVPSYRLLDAEGRELLGVWGQDRLWLVAQKILENS